jgi:glycosyltransferase involved in cell wall biosynthesis
LNIAAGKMNATWLNSIKNMFVTNGKKILLITDDCSATYYLGFYYSLLSRQSRIACSALSKQDIINGTVETEPDIFFEETLSREKPDLVIFNRYGLPHSQLILEKCQQHSIRTVYFIDDDLLQIPANLGNVIQNIHGRKEVVLARNYLLENVDLVWTSTSYLKERLSRRISQKNFIFGGYPPYLERLITSKKFFGKLNLRKNSQSEKFIFGYMGSKGHQEDLEKIVPYIKAILQHFPKTHFQTFGTIAMPDELKLFGNRVSSHKVISNYRKFLEYLYSLDWKFGLAPLENTEFNRCKTPVKYLEYTACNIPTLASNVVVYNQFHDNKEIMLVEDSEWYDKIQYALCHPQMRDELLGNAQKRCRQEFSLNSQQNQIKTILKMLDIT